MKKIVIIILLFLTACTNNFTSDKIDVVATFYPISYFVERIGGNKVEVTNLTENSGDAHHFEPVMQDRITIENSEVLIYNGLGLEEWIDDIIKSVKSDILIIDSSNGIESDDPHIWLDPITAKQQALNIYQGLVTIDPKNESFYKDNLETLLEEFDALISDYDKILSNFSHTSLFIDHLTFKHLENRYGFNQVSLSGYIPETDPSYYDLDQLISAIHQENASIFLVSENQNKKISDTIRNETEVEVLEYFSMEIVSKEQDYFSMMYHNLDVLKEALDA